jgi:hypothetical protein
MSDYLKELEDEKNKLFEINPVAYEEIERVWDIDNIIKGYKKGCKDTEDKIRTKLVLLMSKHYQSNKVNEFGETEFIDMTSINEFCNDIYDYIKELSSEVKE